jgi:type IV pilus assembly protein PilB
MFNNLLLKDVLSSDVSGTVNVVSFVDKLLELSLEQNASDIHIESVEEQTRVRLRIDGLLYTVVEVPRSNHNAIVSRIKIISGMDIAEKRLPQDGRVDLVVSGRKVDLRIATIPVVEGEKLVIRLLDKGQQLKTLDSLDFTDANLETYRKLISQPNGLILVTGPTGSGKSTTLYATLQELNDEKHNIITIEDPVEFKIKGINQINVNNKAGLTFANGLRAIVRQDPNIIMVGEIRDAETARIAVQAALTGHLVFSTLHTNNAIGAITRLVDLGIEPYLVAACLRGVVAQRLVRRICPHCKQRYTAEPVERKLLDYYLCEHDDYEDFKYAGTLSRENVELVDKKLLLHKGYGCSHCNETGYKGRVAVQEVLAVNDNLREMITKGMSEKEMFEVAVRKGFTTLAQDCVCKTLEGVTTFEEALRVKYLNQ